MKPENANNSRILKLANRQRIELRIKLEGKITLLNPGDHPNRYRQLVGQLLRLDKKIDAYEKSLENQENP